MGLFSFLFGVVSGLNEHANEREKALEDRDNFEKKLIDKGLYNEDNFEEEELEEDDYYYEDDE